MEIFRLFLGKKGFERPPKFPLDDQPRLDLRLDLLEIIFQIAIRTPEIRLPSNLVFFRELACVLFTAYPSQQLERVVRQTVRIRRLRKFPSLFPNITPFKSILDANRNLRGVRLPSLACPDINSK